MWIKISDGTIIGGYTKGGWKKSKGKITDYTADKDAFVFYLQSPSNHKPFISNVKQDKESIQRALGYSVTSYGNFGYQWIFHIVPTMQEEGHYIFNSIIRLNGKIMKHSNMINVSYMENLYIIITIINLSLKCFKLSIDD